jgi:hypothetical protein
LREIIRGIFDTLTAAATAAASAIAAISSTPSAAPAAAAHTDAWASAAISAAISAATTAAAARGIAHRLARVVAVIFIQRPGSGDTGLATDELWRRGLRRRRRLVRRRCRWKRTGLLGAGRGCVDEEGGCGDRRENKPPGENFGESAIARTIKLTCRPGRSRRCRR